ncbi:major capsid protein [Gordonia phage Goib]|nr:major capsid protein [Gordonia phage Goib]
MGPGFFVPGNGLTQGDSMKLKDQRAAILAKAEGIVADAAGEELTEEKSVELNGYVAEIEALDARIERAEKDAGLLDAVKSFGAKVGVTPTDTPGGDDAPAKSLGDHFVKSLGDGYRERLRSGVKIASTEFIPAKAAGDTQSTPALSTEWGRDNLQDVDLTVQRAKRDRLVVADLLGKGTMSGTSIKYYLEGAFEGDFEMVAEGGLKPQVHVEDPEPVTDEVRKIAAWIGFTDEILEDMPLWVSEINQRLLYKLAVKEELQLLRGSGAGQNILGLLNRDGVQTIAAGAGDQEDVENIFRAQTLISLATDYQADAVLVNPFDYERFRLGKDANEQYYGGGYFMGQYGGGTVVENPPLWGLRTVVTRAVAKGEAVVGNFAQAATMYRKGGVKVDSTMSDGDDFVHNKVKTRVEERIALAVRQPQAFVKLAFSSATDQG